MDHLDIFDVNSVVAADSLRQATAFPWQSFTFGDAVFTIVTPEQLLEELRHAGGAGWEELLLDLTHCVEQCHLIAFPG